MMPHVNPLKKTPTNNGSSVPTYPEREGAGENVIYFGYGVSANNGRGDFLLPFVDYSLGFLTFNPDIPFSLYFTLLFSFSFSQTPKHTSSKDSSEVCLHNIQLPRLRPSIPSRPSALSNMALQDFV